MSETGYALGKMPEPQNGEEVKECLRHSREVLRKSFGDLFGRTTFDFALEYIERVEYERDAAVEDMTELMQLAQFCRHCKHLTEDGECTFDFAANKDEPWCWQWRGVHPEPPKEDA